MSPRLFRFKYFKLSRRHGYKTYNLRESAVKPLHFYSEYGNSALDSRAVTRPRKRIRLNGKVTTGIVNKYINNRRRGNLLKINESLADADTDTCINCLICILKRQSRCLYKYEDLHTLVNTCMQRDPRRTMMIVLRYSKNVTSPAGTPIYVAQLMCVFVDMIRIHCLEMHKTALLLDDLQKYCVKLKLKRHALIFALIFGDRTHVDTLIDNEDERTVPSLVDLAQRYLYRRGGESYLRLRMTCNDMGVPFSCESIAIRCDRVLRSVLSNHKLFMNQSYELRRKRYMYSTKYLIAEDIVCSVRIERCMFGDIDRCKWISPMFADACKSNYISRSMFTAGELIVAPNTTIAVRVRDFVVHVPINGGDEDTTGGRAVQLRGLDHRFCHLTEDNTFVVVGAAAVYNLVENNDDERAQLVVFIANLSTTQQRIRPGRLLIRTIEY